MREWLKSLDLIQFGILIVGFLFLQDYYVASEVFNIRLGVFIENFVFKLQSWNFIAYMVFIPLFSIASIVYVSYNIYSLKLKIKDEDFKLILFILFFLSFMLVFFDAVINLTTKIVHFLGYQLTFNFYIAGLIYVSFFALFFNLYNAIREKLSIGCILIYSFLLIGCLIFFYDGLLAWLAITIFGVLWILHDSYAILKDESFKSKAYNLLLLILIIGSIDMIMFNSNEWSNKKLEAVKTMGMLNKGFLVKNELNITINGDFDSLDTKDKVLKIIPATDKDHEVYYLPISPEMRWYFIDRRPNEKNSNITIYGVEEKTSTSNPIKKVRNVTFKAYFDINVSK